MNTSTTRQRYTVITVTERDYMELTADPGYVVLGYQTFEYIENNTITRLFTVFIKRAPEVKPDNFKPLQARVIGVNDPLDRLRQNRVKFEVGQLYDFGYNKGDTRIKIEIVTRTDKTITYKHYGFKVLYRRKIQDTDPRYETFYPDKNSICSSRNKGESLPESQIKTVATTDNNLSTFKVGQIYKIGNLVNTAGRVVAITKSTIKVNFLIAVYDKKIDCFQWWESKEPKTYKIKDNITSQVIFVDHHGTKLHMLSSELSNIDEGSIRTAINNPFLPKEVRNTLYQLNGHKTGSYYWYDNK